MTGICEKNSGITPEDRAACERWIKNAVEDADIIREITELQASEDWEGIHDRFYRDLEFGTGGLRGIIGAGSNRMNLYTVRKATQGLANYLNGSGLAKRAAIAYDSRIKSDLFAREAARVLAANGITAFLYPRLEPTPALSWAVRYLGCGAGICITASHNPAQYNGYKVYHADGCQITLENAKKILHEINRVDCFDQVKAADFGAALAEGSIQYIPEDCLDAYVDAVYAQRVGGGDGIKALRLVYTPLNGAGLECVEKLLAKLGVESCQVVPEQREPDGNFPTCPFPNPEIPEAMSKGLELCARVKPDLLLGTDPDCDRCSVAAPDGRGGYRLLNGNELGVLLLDYVCRMRLARGAMPPDPVAVTTIVSTDMADPLCRQYGVELRRTLTGFKFIGEQIGLLEQQGAPQRFIFGFEESYGYLSGAHVRDKDAVNAVLLVCEAAAWYAQQGKTLLDGLTELCARFGWYKNGLHSVAFEGESGLHTMERLMRRLRTEPPKAAAGMAVEQIIDYASGSGGLPKADVLEFRLEGNAKLIVRPSGTEPKIKVYLSSVGETEAQADMVIAQLKGAVDEIFSAAPYRQST